MYVIADCYLYFYHDENGGIQLTFSTYACHNVFFEHGRSKNDHHFRFLVDHSLIDTDLYDFVVVWVVVSMVSKIFLFYPETWGKRSQFDLRIFFDWVETNYLLSWSNYSGGA